MAKVATFGSRLRDGLIQGLRTAGIEATVDIERVRGTKLHRVFVVQTHLPSCARQSDRTLSGALLTSH
jgi:hypothetical protein